MFNNQNPNNVYPGGVDPYKNSFNNNMNVDIYN